MTERLLCVHLHMKNLVNGFKTVFIRCIRTTRLRKRNLNNTIWQQSCSARHSQGSGYGSGYKTECDDHSGERVFRGPQSMHVKDLSCRCRKRVYAHCNLYNRLFLSPLTKLSIPHDFRKEKRCSFRFYIQLFGGSLMSYLHYLYL